MDVRTPQRLRRKVGRGEPHSAGEPHPCLPGEVGREHGGLRATWIDEERSSRSREVLPVLVRQVVPGLLGREGPAGLTVAYLADGVPVTVRWAEAGRRRKVHLDAAAWNLLERRSVVPRPVILDRGRPRLSPERLGLWALCAADGADGARLLTRTQRERLVGLAGPGPYRVSLVRRELVLLAPIAHFEAVAALEALSPGPGGIAGEFTLGLDGVLRSTAAAA